MHIEGLPVPRGAWVLHTTPVQTASGQAIRASDYTACFPGLGADAGEKAQAKAGGPPAIGQITSCLAGHDLHESITYQPAGHYWPLQWIETGIFLLISALLSGFCFFWIRRLS